MPNRRRLVFVAALGALASACHASDAQTCTLLGPCCPQYSVDEAVARVGIEPGEAVRAYDDRPFTTEAGEISFDLRRKRVLTGSEVVDDECSPTLLVAVDAAVHIDDERIGGLDGHLGIGWDLTALFAKRPTRVEGRACDCQTEVAAILEGEPEVPLVAGDRGEVIVRCPIDERYPDCMSVSDTSWDDVVEVLAVW